MVLREIAEGEVNGPSSRLLDSVLDNAVNTEPALKLSF